MNDLIEIENIPNEIFKNNEVKGLFSIKFKKLNNFHQIEDCLNISCSSSADILIKNFYTDVRNNSLSNQAIFLATLDKPHGELRKFVKYFFKNKKKALDYGKDIATIYFLGFLGYIYLNKSWDINKYTDFELLIENIKNYFDNGNDFDFVKLNNSNLDELLNASYNLLNKYSNFNEIIDKDDDSSIKKEYEKYKLDLTKVDLNKLYKQAEKYEINLKKKPEVIYKIVRRKLRIDAYKDELDNSFRSFNFKKLKGRLILYNSLNINIKKKEFNKKLQNTSGGLNNLKNDLKDSGNEYLTLAAVGIKSISKIIDSTTKNSQISMAHLMNHFVKGKSYDMVGTIFKSSNKKQIKDFLDSKTEEEITDNLIDKYTKDVDFVIIRNIDYNKNELGFRKKVYHKIIKNPYFILK